MCCMCSGRICRGYNRFATKQQQKIKKKKNAIQYDGLKAPMSTHPIVVAKRSRMCASDVCNQQRRRYHRHFEYRYLYLYT